MKAFIFDMDGVIINSEPLHFEVDKIILESVGKPATEDYLDKFVGLTNTAMWQRIKKDLDIDNSIEELIDMQVGTKLKLLKERQYKAIEGIPELMRSLRESNIPVAVASSSPLVFIDAVLEQTAVKEFISVFRSAEDVPNGKPAPDVFLDVAKQMRVSPAEAFVLEDSKSGVAAAKAAGMKCIGFQNPSSGKQDLRQADFIVSEIKEISLKQLIQNG